MAKTSMVTDWHRPDNNAHLFMAVSGKKLSNVFRISVVLKENIEPVLLQQALEDTLPHFKAFAVRIKKGLFWNYFETNNAVPQIEEEKNFPCRYMDPHQNNLFLFRVSYFGRKVNLEVFHALTDGTGGLNFLLAVCYRYIMLKHRDDFSEKELKSLYGISYSTNTEDSYIKNYTPTKKETYGSQRAHILKGEIFPLDTVGVIHANIRIDQIKKAAKSYGATITQYLAACIQWGIYTELNKIPPKYPINTFIPVNLRPYFGSTTTLNFFSGITISIDYKEKNYEFTDVIEEVKCQFKTKLTKEAMSSKLAYTVGDGYSIPARIVPFPLKKLALQIIYKRSRRSNSMTLTNVGPVEVLPRFKPYFEKFILLLSASEKERIKSSVISYENTLVFSFSSVFKRCNYQKYIIRKMAEDGLEIVIESNGAYEHYKGEEGREK